MQSRMRLLSIAGHDLGTSMSLRIGRRSEGGGSVAKLLALQARPSLSWAHGRRDAGVEASGSGRSSVGDDGYDPLELEDETHEEDREQKEESEGREARSGRDSGLAEESAAGIIEYRQETWEEA